MNEYTPKIYRVKVAATVLAIFFGLFVTPYVVIAFIFWEPNPELWHGFWRFVYASGVLTGIWYCEKRIL